MQLSAGGKGEKLHQWWLEIQFIPEQLRFNNQLNQKLK
jgi:hypothetical protein